MSEETKELKAMRSMAWERAKGELRSMRETYRGNEDKLEQFDKHYERFKANVESFELQR